MAKYRILYVDDDDNLLEIGKKFIEMDSEIKVNITNSPQEAIALVENDDSYDLIVSDYEMGLMNGIDLLRRIRSGSRNNLPFILFTGRKREEVVIEAINNGATFYVSKGGGKDQFAELDYKIKLAIDRYRLTSGFEKIQELVAKITKEKNSLRENLLFTLKSMNDLLFIDYSCIYLYEDKKLFFFVSCKKKNEIDIYNEDIFQSLGSSVVSDESDMVFLEYSEKEEGYLESKNFSSFFLTSIKFRKDVVGVLYVFRHGNNTFSTEKVEVITFVKNLIAMQIMADRL